MRAIDLSPPAVVEVDESTNLSEAARLMREEGIGDLIITRGEGRAKVPVGIVTDRDIVVHAVACGLDVEVITVADLATRPPVTVSVGADLAEIAAVMRQNGVRRVIVTRGAELAGVVSMDKLVMATADLLNDLSETLGRQYEYEQVHLEGAATRSKTAAC